MKDLTKSTCSRQLFPVVSLKLKYRDTCQVWLASSMHWSLHTNLVKDSAWCKHLNSYRTSRWDCCLAFRRGEAFPIVLSAPTAEEQSIIYYVNDTFFFLTSDCKLFSLKGSEVVFRIDAVYMQTSCFCTQGVVSMTFSKGWWYNWY